MTGDRSKDKWHQIDPETAKELSALSTTPGLVYPVGSNAIPPQLKNMPGIVDYYVSSFTLPLPGITVGGEIAVVRHDGEIAKVYNFIYGTSTNGLVYFNGPHKDIPAHHFHTSSPVPIDGLFGHPLAKTKT